MRYLKDDMLLKVVKILATLLQGISTFSVFYKVNSDAGYTPVVALGMSLCSVALVDVLFLFVLHKMEDPDELPGEKLPWVIVSVVLLIFVLVIGYVDENKQVLSFAPRMGLVALVLADLSLVANQERMIRNDREYQEKRIRDQQVIKRRKSQLKAWKEARKFLYPRIVLLEKQKELDRLGVSFTEIDLLEPSAWARMKRRVTGKQSYTQITPTTTKMLSAPAETDDLPEGVVIVGGGYGWVHPETEEIMTHTSTDKPYTLSGAKIALGRHKG